MHVFLFIISFFLWLSIITLINLYVFLHVICFSLWLFINEQTLWGNLYHLLCASPLNRVIGETSIIYYVLPHRIGLPDGRIVIGETSIIYYVLPHPISRFSLKTRMGPTRSYWGNPYHLLCASPSYFSIFFENTHGPNPLLLGKSLPFTMCFPILFLDFLWKHAWAQLALTGETPIIYYVLPHRVPRRAHCHWGNLYYLMGASPLDRVIGETSIIYYVLPHPILRRASWGHPYYLLCASPSCSSASALPLGKPLLFSGCFPSYRCSRLGIDPDRGRCQAIPRDIGETSII